MKNAEGDILYVGKAKSLKNRVRSYFTGSHDLKTQKLVSEIRDFEYIVTKNNVEALILECNLIKQYRPRYNVLLRDDKSFPYIKITNEKHPRLEVTRRVVRDRGKYFGPYPNAYAAHDAKKLLDRLYPLRKCKTMPKRVCLYYHIGQCLGPCEYEVDPAEYERMIRDISRFLGGDYEGVKKDLIKKMEEAAEELKFERAKELRDLIRHIEMIMEKQAISTGDAVDRDIFGWASDKGWMCIQILYMRGGRIVGSRTAHVPHYGDEREDFLSFVSQYYSDNPVRPKEILLPDAGPGTEDVRDALERWLGVDVRVPKRGTRKDMVHLAMENAKTALEERFRLMERDAERTVRAVAQLGEATGLGYLRRIEAFDNSHLYGTDPVSALVVFIDGKPEKKEYRKFKIKSARGPDDYEAMREVVRRRYERVLKEGGELPDLIVVDGGKGQIAAAVDVLENELGLAIPVCGLVKDERHRTSQLLLGDPPEPIPIARDSHAFFLLQRIQEEVHRFALQFHRKTRAKSMIASRLDDIPGVGEKRRRLLFQHFGSIENIKNASVEEFRSLGIGDKLAPRILAALTEKPDGSGDEGANADVNRLPQEQAQQASVYATDDATPS